MPNVVRWFCTDCGRYKSAFDTDKWGRNRCPDCGKKLVYRRLKLP